jgi:hypothetical protein
VASSSLNRLSRKKPKLAEGLIIKRPAASPADECNERCNEIREWSVNEFEERRKKYEIIFILLSNDDWWAWRTGANGALELWSEMEGGEA